MKFLLPLFITVILLTGCSGKKTLPERFGGLMCEKHPRLSYGNQVLFIINKPECSPCIKAIEKTMRADYGAGKSIIRFGNSPLQVPEDAKFLTEDEQTIARYGMLGVDGTICVFSDGRLIHHQSFDTGHPEKAISEIENAFRNNKPLRVSFRDNF